MILPGEKDILKTLNQDAFDIFQYDEIVDIHIQKKYDEISEMYMYKGYLIVTDGNHKIKIELNNIRGDFRFSVHVQAHKMNLLPLQSTLFPFRFRGPENSRFRPVYFRIAAVFDLPNPVFCINAEHSNSLLFNRLYTVSHQASNH